MTIIFYHKQLKNVYYLDNSYDMTIVHGFFARGHKIVKAAYMVDVDTIIIIISSAR
jgi:hypothetical protein